MNRDLQGAFLNIIRKNKIPVKILLHNGKLLTGEVNNFDKFTIVLFTNNKQQIIVYKSEIMTVVPLKNFPF